MANPSASTIIGLARDLMKTEGGSDVPAVGDDFMILAIADIDKELLRAYRKGGGNTPVERGLEGGVTLVADTAVNNSSGVATTDVTITVDAQTFPDAAGAAAMWTNDMPDVYFYTSKSSTIFSGVTGIGFAHGDNDAVQALYALPSNFGQFRRSEEYGDGVQLNGSPLTYMEGPPTPGHFSKRSDGTTSYLWLPQGSSDVASYLFDKDSNTIDSTDDLVSLPDDWQFVYAWRCIELGVFGRGDVGLMALAKQKGDALKLDLLKDRNIGRRVRVRPLMMLGNSRRDLLPDLENE